MGTSKKSSGIGMTDALTKSSTYWQNFSLKGKLQFYPNPGQMMTQKRPRQLAERWR